MREKIYQNDKFIKDKCFGLVVKKYKETEKTKSLPSNEQCLSTIHELLREI